METKYTPAELESDYLSSELEAKYSPSELDIKFSPSDIESMYNPSDIDTKYCATDFLDGVPNTPRSLSDFSTNSPDGFMSSRDASPLSFVSTQLTDLSRLTAGEDTKDKPEPEKKPVKKRKSWGQQLPTPTTNLAPRKRAKTAEEKEQRRVERVLRNRAAAQKSREVKKQQLEKIEQERDILKEQNELLISTNKQLEQFKQQLLEHTRRLEDENRQLRNPSSETDSNGDSIAKDPSLKFAVTSAFLDPTSLIANCESIPSDGSISFPSMTHQPAALMCDLPCLQRVLMMIFLPVLATMVNFVVVSCLMFSTNSPMWTRASPHLRNPLQFCPPIQYWKILSIALETTLQHVTSRVCSSVLAHPRIATDYSSPLTLSAEGVLVSSEPSSSCRVGGSGWRFIRDNWIHTNQKIPRGIIGYRHVKPANWVAGLVTG